MSKSDKTHEIETETKIVDGKKELGRRAFVKLVGGTSVAVSAAGVLVSDALLPQQAEAAPIASLGPIWPAKPPSTAASQSIASTG